MKTIQKSCFWLLVILLAMPLKPAVADLVCPFTGQVDFGHKKFNLTLKLGEESSVSFEGTSVSQDNYNLQVNVNHIRTSVFDLSTEFQSSIGVKNRENIEKRSISGQFSSRYSLINFKPFRELSGNFEMKDKRLYLQSMTLGGVTLNGYVDLFSPYKIDLSFILNEIKMADFLAFWGAEDLNSQGMVSGQILVSGIYSQPGLKGSLASYNGFVDQLDYDSIILNLEGNYPLVHLSNSTVAQSDGMTFNLEGDFDLSKKERFEEEISALKMLPLVSENKLSQEWTIKRRETSPTSNATELKYFHRVDRPNPGTLKEGSDMLGVERSFKF